MGNGVYCRVKLYRIIFFIGIILFLAGVFWGVSVAGKSYNQMMQARKVPPLVELENSTVGYHISFMGDNMGQYPAIKNPIPPEKAKGMVDKISTVSQSNKVIERVIAETERNLHKLWLNSKWSKKEIKYHQMANELKGTSIKLGNSLLRKIKKIVEKGSS